MPTGFFLKKARLAIPQNRLQKKTNRQKKITDLGRFYNDKGPIHQEDIKIINTYASNKRVIKYMKQKLT